MTRRLALLAALASALSCALHRPAPASTRAAEVARVEAAPGETAVVFQVDGAAVVWFIARQ